MHSSGVACFDYDLCASKMSHFFLFERIVLDVVSQNIPQKICRIGISFGENSTCTIINDNST